MTETTQESVEIINPIKLKMFFSLTSGEIYEVQEDEVKNLDEHQVPLLQRPTNNCKKCYDRLYIGKHMSMTPEGWQFDYYMMCPKCSKKCIDFNQIIANGV
jgi:hypothetical protein